MRNGLQALNWGGFFPGVRLGWRTPVALAAVLALVFALLRWASQAPPILHGPKLELGSGALVLYAAYSLARMLGAYLLSLAFTFTYGTWAARSAAARAILLPLLDVLQSVPILSFLPAVLLAATAIFPQGIAVELAAVVLLCTSQVWNLTFAWYQSLTTEPADLDEAARLLRLGGAQRLRVLDLPFATQTLIWNSMMSWAGGWFFLMAAESFRVGDRDFRLPGLGSFLQSAAEQGAWGALAIGVVVLVGLILLLDALVWRPLIAWSYRFKLDMVPGEPQPRSRVLNWLRQARVLRTGATRLAEMAKPALRQCRQTGLCTVIARIGRGLVMVVGVAAIVGAVAALVRLVPAAASFFTLSPSEWLWLVGALAATAARVACALVLAAAWTIPLAVVAATRPRLRAVVQPVAQTLASIPATAFFPLLILWLTQAGIGLGLVAVFLMLLGSQWYLLFNALAGVASIPQDLIFNARLLRLGRWQRWRALWLPAMFPFLITGGITAAGGAWNASIVAEYAHIQGRTLQSVGVGAAIASATAEGNMVLLYAATSVMVLTVVGVNRLVWRRLYGIAERRFRLD